MEYVEDSKDLLVNWSNQHKHHISMLLEWLEQLEEQHYKQMEENREYQTSSKFFWSDTPRSHGLNGFQTIVTVVDQCVRQSWCLSICDFCNLTQQISKVVIQHCKTSGIRFSSILGMKVGFLTIKVWIQGGWIWDEFPLPCFQHQNGWYSVDVFS